MPILLARLKRPEQALAMLQGDDEALVAARTARPRQDSRSARRSRRLARAMPEMLIALAVDLGRDDNKALADRADPGRSPRQSLQQRGRDPARPPARQRRPGPTMRWRLLGAIGPGDLLAGEALAMSKPG